MNDTKPEDAREELCAICGERLGEEEWYFGELCTDYGLEGYAHARCA